MLYRCRADPRSAFFAMEAAVGSTSRRRKTAAERRAQQLRSDGRTMLRVASMLSGISSHRGNELGRVGRALQQALGADRSSEHEDGGRREAYFPSAVHFNVF